MPNNKVLHDELVRRNIFTGYEPDFASSWLSNLDFEWSTQPVTLESFTAFYTGPYEVTPTTRLAPTCSMGAFSYTHSPLHPRMRVGRFTSIARGLELLDFSHPVERLSSSIAFFVANGALNPLPLSNAISSVFRSGLGGGDELFDPTRFTEYPIIENDVWIGKNVTLSMGVTIGTGSVVAANSLVTRDVEPYSIVGGVPARVIRYRFPETLREDLFESKWWDFDYSSLRRFDFTSPESIVAELRASTPPRASYDSIVIFQGQIVE